MWRLVDIVRDGPWLSWLFCSWLQRKVVIASMVRSPSKRAWYFTANDLSDDVRAHFVQLVAEGHPRISYCVYQEEAAPTTGHLHYQGYVQCTGSIRRTAIVRILGGRVNVTGPPSASRAIAYCTKERTRVEGGVSATWGVPRGVRARGPGKSSLLDVGTAILDGGDIHEICEAREFSGMMIRYEPQVVAYSLRRKPDRDWMMNVIILVGPTRCGKTQWILRNFEQRYFASPRRGDHWWFDGYRGEDCVVLDDYMPRYCRIEDLMKLFDSCPWQPEVKGALTRFVSHTVVVSTNVDPRDWYPGQLRGTQKMLALEARIREFAKVFDCSRGETVEEMGRVMRTEGVFEFRDDHRRTVARTYDFSTRGSSGGRGAGSTSYERDFVARANGESAGIEVPMLDEDDMM